MANIKNWNEQDLNHILNKGDQLSKAKNMCNFLSTEVLPISIKINEAEFNIVKLSNYHGRLSCFNTCISNVHKNDENTGNEPVLVFTGFSVSVIWNKAYYFLFDPHRRDSNGLMCENGTAVLLKFFNKKFFVCVFKCVIIIQNKVFTAFAPFVIAFKNSYCSIIAKCGFC